MADVNSVQLYSFSSQCPSRCYPYCSRSAASHISIWEIKFRFSAGFQWFSAFREQTRKTQKLITAVCINMRNRKFTICTLPHQDPWHCHDELPTDSFSFARFARLYTSDIYILFQFTKCTLEYKFYKTSYGCTGYSVLMMPGPMGHVNCACWYGHLQSPSGMPARHSVLDVLCEVFSMTSARILRKRYDAD